MSDRAGRVGAGVDTDRQIEASVPAKLLGDDMGAVERALTGQSPGPLAVCSPPFGGRKRVLEQAADRLGTDLLLIHHRALNGLD